MEHKATHKQGPVFSRIISGAWRWKLEESKIEQLIHASLDSGINTFDHADIAKGDINQPRLRQGDIRGAAFFPEITVVHVFK